MLGTPKFTDEFFDYSPYFHDGAIVSLKPTPRGYLLEMESAQLHLCDNQHLFPLCERNTLYGFLHIEGVRKILCDATKVHSIKQEEDFFSINTFDVSATEVCVTGQWVILSEEYESYAPPYCIEISAEKIYWENTADGQKPEMLGSYLYHFIIKTCNSMNATIMEEVLII